ncbi:MAG: hypothetical protein JWO19_5052 [Bryobacterales bacterium]|nr:hypothetical protein [Bryobacterales bacterium]
MGDSQPISGRYSGPRGARSSKSEAVPHFSRRTGTRFSKWEAVPILLLVGASLAWADPPAAVMEVFRGVSEALANRDADAFLDQFDRQMPEYEKLRDEIRELVGVAQEIGSTIDVITDEGDEQKRTLELDWLLKIDTDEPRRQIVKCQVEKQGKKWKITRLEPVEFFRK